jgi:succinylarginine dihydrolase
VPQGFLLPHDRPHVGWLRDLGFSGSDRDVLAAAAREDPALLAAAFSASAMWTANAATVSPAADTRDGRTHLTVANLSTMPHRSHEWTGTLAQLRLAFANSRHFVVHGPVPATFGDEGAANHMRLAPAHEAPGVEVFVHGEKEAGGPFPARQHARASAAIVRRHGVDQAILARQDPVAIAAGAFHNDVVAVANGTVLFAHEQAFADRNALVDALARAVPGFILVEAPAAEVSLADAVRAYLFNAQLLTLPDGMALVLPKEAQETPAVWAWLQKVVAANSNPIGALHVLDLRESMRNGGGPACLRLRVALSDEALAAVDPRFLASEAVLDRLEALVEATWPASLQPSDFALPELWDEVAQARRALLDLLGISPDELAQATRGGR